MTLQPDNLVSTYHDASGRSWMDFAQVTASVMLAKRHRNWTALTCAHAVRAKLDSSDLCPCSESQTVSHLVNSHMHVMDHNWSARKEHLHLQSVAGKSHHLA